MNYAIKLNSDIKTVGYTKDPVSKSASSESAASKAFKKIFANKNATPSGTTSDKAEQARTYPSFDKAPKEYGAHQGTQHACILASGTVNIEELDSITLILDNAITALRQIEQIPFHKMVSQYKEARSKAADDLVKAGKSILKPEEHQSYRESLKDVSFNYAVSQISLIVWDTERFHDNCYFDRGRNLYVMIFKGKTSYTSALLNPSELKKVKDLSTSKTRVENKINSTINSMIVGQLQKSNDGQFRLIAIQSTVDRIEKMAPRVSATSWEDVDF